jgi:hypothetical protein
MTLHRGSRLVFKFLNGAQAKARSMAEELAHVVHKRFELSRITAIAEDHSPGHQTVTEQPRQQLRAITILHACGGDHHGQQLPVCVGEYMWFAG